MKNLSRYDENLSVPRKKDVDDKQTKISANGILQGDGNGNISAAAPGVDYALQSLGLSNAAVGQVPAVKAVDPQGKPTSWEPSSAPGILSVTILPSGNTGEFTCDKTNAEIYEAFSAGKIVICDFIGLDRMQCVDAGAEYAIFLAVSSGSGAASVSGVDISTNRDTQTVYVRDEVMLVAVPSSPDNMNKLISFDGMGVPVVREFDGLLYGEQDGSVTSLGCVTEDDNGKFLRVVDGMWQAVTMDNANGVTF